MANLSPLVGGAWRYPQVTTDEINSGLSEAPKRWSVKDILDLMAVREPWGDALGEVGEGSGAALQSHKQSGDHDDRYLRLSGGRVSGNIVYRNVTQGSWARGLSGLTTNDARAGGLGILGNGDSVVGVYMGLGANPWESGNGVRVTASGVAIGGVLSGNGSGLTSLNASQLTAGTLPTARLSGNYDIAITGNAASATKLQTQRTINGTNFDGTSNINTSTWGTSRNLTIGNTAKAVNGSGNVSWTLAEIGAAPTTHNHAWGNITGAPVTATRWPSWSEVTGKPGTTASRTDASTTTLLQAKAMNDHCGSGDHDSRYLRLSGGDLTRRLLISHNTSAGHDYSGGQLELRSTNGSSVSLSFHRSGHTACQLRHDSNGLILSGTSQSTAANLAVTGNVTATSFIGALSGSATTLATARTINGTSFNGSANITTANWGAARNLTVGNTTKSVNGGSNVSWSLAEIGAASANHSHTIVSVTDSRGAARTPNFFTGRAVRWDFIENTHTGAGGDSWNVLMTVSPWSGYQPTHRQQQIAFVGTGWLKHRHATSDNAWSPWLTIVDSGNISSFAAPPTHNHAWGNITGVPTTATRWPSWTEVTGKPGTTASRTDASTTTLLQAKAMSDHRASGDHDSRYYTKTETNSLTKHHLRFRWGDETVTLTREGYITRYINNHNSGPGDTTVNLTTSTFQVGDLIEIYFLGPTTRTLRINNSNGTIRAPDGSTLSSFATVNAPAKVVLAKQENNNNIMIISIA